MYFDCLPSEILPTIIKYVLVWANAEEEEETEGGIKPSSKMTKHIRNLLMLLSDDSPFREAVSQLQLSEVRLDRFSDASCLWMGNGIVVVGPELFKNQGLKLGIAERIFQLCEVSVKFISFYILYIGASSLIWHPKVMMLFRNLRYLSRCTGSVPKIYISVTCRTSCLLYSSRSCMDYWTVWLIYVVRCFKVVLRINEKTWDIIITETLNFVWCVNIRVLISCGR